MSFQPDGQSVRATDINGWYEIPRNPIARAGAIFPYTAKSINAPDAATNPNRIYRVYRPESELSDPDAIASMRLVPWTDEHAMLGNPDIGQGLTAPENKGVHGVTGEQQEYDPTTRTLYSNLKIFANSMQDAIEAGKKELSLGFRCVYDFVNGMFEGQPYDAVQRFIRGNHIATVQHGRMGPDVAVLDAEMSFTFDAKELIPMAATPKAKTTIRARLMKKMGVTTQAAFDAAMDAEADAEAEGDGGGSGDMSLADVSAMLKELAPQVKGLVGALASMAPAAPGADPIDDPAADDDMEPVVDAAGAAVIDPATGKPKMQKKVAPVAPSADAGAIPAMDALDTTIRTLKTSAARLRAGVAANPALLPMVAAMDADIATAERTLTALRAPNPNAAALATIQRDLKRLQTGMDAAPKAPDMKTIMAEVAKRDDLAKRVSQFVGTFDHSVMTSDEVAKYAVTKFDLKGITAGQEITAVESYMYGRTPAHAASTYGFDAAPNGTVKPSASVNTYLTGATKAA